MANDVFAMNRGLAWKGASFANEALKAFRTSLGSADRDLSADRKTLLYRARALYQNSSFAGALINTIDTNVVGSGLKCRPTLVWEALGLDREQAKAWESKVQNLFELWSGSKKCDAERRADFHELQSLSLKTQFVTGDCFGLMQYKAGDGFGLQLKLLEGDRCQNPFGILDSERLAQGVEVDEFGAALAYHFTKKCPFNLDNYTDVLETVRVPALDELGNVNVIHCFTADRTDQRRGVSVLAPIISQIKQQERYQDAELMAAVISSMFTVFIKNNNTESSEEFYGNVAEDQRVEKRGDSYKSALDGAKNSACELNPGGIVELTDGQEIQIADPKRPNANYSPFVDAIFRETAARVGIGYEVVLKNFGSSYNAVRAALLESKKTFSKVKHNFVSDFLQPVYEKWLTQAVITGQIEAPGFFNDPVKRALWCQCSWIGDSAFLLDPLKETQAIKMQLDEQLISRDMAVAMISGGKYERNARELSEEKELRERLGLPEPGAVSKSESVSVTETEDVGGDNEDGGDEK